MARAKNLAAAGDAGVPPDVDRLDRGDLSPLVFLLHLARLVLDIERRMPSPSDRLKGVIQSGRPPIVDPILQLVDEVTDGFARLGRDPVVRPLRQLAWLKVGLYLARSTNRAGPFVERFRAIARSGEGTIYFFPASAVKAP